MGKLKMFGHPDECDSWHITGYPGTGQHNILQQWRFLTFK